MKAKERSGWIRVITWSTLFLTSLSTFYGQTQINLGTQGRNVDFTNAPYTKPIRSGSSLPTQCSAGEFFLNTGAMAGQNLFACLGATWTMMAGMSGLPDPGANGLVKRTGVNTTTAVTAPSGTVVGTTDVQTLTGKSIDASEINSGVLSSARIPALSGDVSSTSGSTATALTTVMQTPGSFGDANHTLQLSVDSKGRVTSLTAVPITTGLTSAFYQQVSKNGTASNQRPALNFSGAFAVSDNSGSLRTDIDLATVNSTAGTFGGANQIPVITVNGYGQITAVSTATSAAGTNNATNSVSAVTSGALSSIPSSCTTGALYFSTDQPAGQQLYVCSASNSWAQSLSLGNSGGLAFNNGSLDIVTSVVPRLTAANHFTGSNQLDGTTTLSNVNITGSCTGCNSTGFANPMTTLGDQMVGGANGVATRAAIGAPGQVWTVGSAGQPVWASIPAQTASNSLTSLTQTASGDLQYMSPDASGTSFIWGNSGGNSSIGTANWQLLPGGNLNVFLGSNLAFVWAPTGDAAALGNLQAVKDLQAGAGIVPNIQHSATDPSCSSPTADRNRIWITNPGNGVEDGMKVCHMLANGTMAWKVVY